MTLQDPPRAALCSTEFLMSLHTLSTRAPACSNTFATLLLPLMAAHCSGVLPATSRQCTLAPCRKHFLVNATSPLLAASNSKRS